MKIVLIKRNNYLIILLGLISMLSCKKNNNEKNIFLKDGEKIVDTTKGIYIKYPFLQNIDYLEEKKQNEIIQVVLEKRITKDSLNYFLRTRSYTKVWSTWNSRLIICRYTQDFEPTLSNKLDLEIEKKIYKTPQKSYVVKFGYGSNNITWNYLFQIDDLNKNLYLKDIFYMEDYKNNSGIDQDTLMYIMRIKIDKRVNSISTQKIDSLFNHLDKINIKNKEWVTK